MLLLLNYLQANKIVLFILYKSIYKYMLSLIKIQKYKLYYPLTGIYDMPLTN